MKYVFLLLFCSLCALAQLDAPARLKQANELFDKGNDLASQDFSAATQCWRQSAALMEEAVASRQLANGPLFYNLGNVYFRLNDLGNAIYNYRKAEYYMPGDSNLSRNLNIAKRLRQDKIEEQEKTKVLKTILFWHYDFSIFTREKLFLACVLLSFVFLMLRLKWKAASLGWLASISLLLLLTMASSISVTEYQHASHPAGVVIASEVIARTGYSDSYPPKFDAPLHAGTDFTLLDTRTSWLEIKLADGSTAWIPNSSAKLL